MERVIAAGALGRSATHIRLLRYLAEATEAGRVAREVDVAADVLGRVDSDSLSDSTARVNVHNLRQKLEAFYETDDSGVAQMLVIPKGRYQLVLEDRDPSTGRTEGRRFPFSAPWLALVALALLAIAFLAGRTFAPGPAERASAFAAAPAWRGILDDHRPVTIVVGDYFIFSEARNGWPGNRLIRDFAINSPEDFQDWLGTNPDLQGNYLDIRLTYLPTGTAEALNEVLSVLRLGPRPITVVPQSQFRAEQLRESHIVYLGLLSGMGQLGQFPFLASRLQIGDSFDELIDMETGEHFESSAGPVTETGVSYQDFGYVSTFPGPSGNQLLYITGMRDEGLMQMASVLSNPAVANALGATAGGESEPAFEALYQVSGIDRTYLAEKELFAGPIDVSKIWMDTAR